MHRALRAAHSYGAGGTRPFVHSSTARLFSDRCGPIRSADDCLLITAAGQKAPIAKRKRERTRCCVHEVSLLSRPLRSSLRHRAGRLPRRLANICLRLCDRVEWGRSNLRIRTGTPAPGPDQTRSRADQRTGSPSEWSLGAALARDAPRRLVPEVGPRLSPDSERASERARAPNVSRSPTGSAQAGARLMVALFRPAKKRKRPYVSSRESL